VLTKAGREVIEEALPRKLTPQADRPMDATPPPYVSFVPAIGTGSLRVRALKLNFCFGDDAERRGGGLARPSRRKNPLDPDVL